MRRKRGSSSSRTRNATTSGSTAACYSRAFLGETSVEGARFSAFPSDYVTVNGYLGTDGIVPFVEDCKERDKGIFVLVKTSNPSSGELQNLLLENGTPVYEYMAASWKNGEKAPWENTVIPRSARVVGATHPEEAARLRKKLPHTFFLIPGYGAQGGSAEMLRCCFGKDGLGGVVNNSRGILCCV